MFRSRRPAPTPRLAFAGSGTITVVHGLAAAALGMPVTAVASRQLAHAEARAEPLGARACEYVDLPADADAVVVATPPARHAADAIAALEAGAGVLLEKPLASTLAEADAIVAAAEGRTLVYAENQAFAPVIRQALELIGGLGPLGYVEARALSPLPTWGDFLDPSWGGGVLFDLGVHPLALVMLAAGSDQPASVAATVESSDGLLVDDYAVVHLTFASGLEARIEVSWREPEPIWDLQVSSGTGVVRAELFPAVALEQDGEPVAVPAPAGPADPRIEGFGYVAQLQALSSALAGRPSPIDARFGRRVLEIVCAAYASAGDDGASVALPFSGRRDLTPLRLWRG